MLLITEYSLRIAHRGCPKLRETQMFSDRLKSLDPSFFFGGDQIGYPVTLSKTNSKAPERDERPIFHGCSAGSFK